MSIEPKVVSVHVNLTWSTRLDSCQHGHCSLANLPRIGNSTDDLGEQVTDVG
ncbi:hypothetical protein COCVIDRAFT_104986 [Bipolaris victoriae FI3]|uniref:Uncharacterized protein n=2 Tax=Bipolaris TaxID=33194 RepID=W6Y762_COCC2|nr:uncharacterized protein COCCADRAFT_90864 [Bipolaris zeicola 26-R-13]XP_014554460.1 hypothetical protein COCVIDRAFT_104986 [Bipolaris victoriae FI3]EUC35427.1 hypothetical protein COCCADRAFT_90864 [Bipolaris zeicola 26-R-13]